MAEFRFGNAELAAELGADVGEPLTDEKRLSPDTNDTYQVTTTGMVYYFAELPGQGVRGSQFVLFHRAG